LPFVLLFSLSVIAEPGHHVMYVQRTYEQQQQQQQQQQQ
jgi:hypothetical protein